MARYVIVGAGVAGLSAAMHLPADATIVLEAASEVGGVCRTLRRDGFSFDRAGHFLHLRDNRTKGLVSRLLADQLIAHSRRASIYFAGTFVPYPFQAHLGWLPGDVRTECLLAFINAVSRQSLELRSDSAHLLEWFNRTFGEGITRHFLEPQNTKTYCADLRDLAPDAVANLAPQPSLELVITGALSNDSLAKLGYNAEFYYPRIGGIDLLPLSMASKLSNVRLEHPVVELDARQRRLVCAAGEQWHYDKLISTMPLDQLLNITTGLPRDIKASSDKLRTVDVLDVQLGVAGPAQVPYHWIYFPQKRFAFNRVVIASNVCPGMAPSGHSTLQAEVNCPAGTPVNGDELISRCTEELEALGLLTPHSVISASVHRIDGAYVVHDHFRKKELPKINQALRNASIYCIGRYGTWGYGGMESAIIEGLEVARDLQVMDRLRPLTQS
jgi:protoporphyrinogen oxidase